MYTEDMYNTQIIIVFWRKNQYLIILLFVVFKEKIKNDKNLCIIIFFYM
jgi:hypothetical protein